MTAKKKAMYFKELLPHVQKMSLHCPLIIWCCYDVALQISNFNQSTVYLLFCCCCCFLKVQSSYLMFHLETFNMFEFN